MNIRGTGSGRYQHQEYLEHGRKRAWERYQRTGDTILLVLAVILLPIVMAGVAINAGTVSPGVAWVMLVVVLTAIVAQVVIWFRFRLEMKRWRKR